MITQFEEKNLLYKTLDNAESGDKSNDNSIMTLLISKEEMDMMDSGNRCIDETIPTEMLEDIRDGSKSCTIVNSRESR